MYFLRSVFCAFHDRTKLTFSAFFIVFMIYYVEPCNILSISVFYSIINKRTLKFFYYTFEEFTFSSAIKAWAINSFSVLLEKF